MERRNDCLKYIINNYQAWPEPHETSHTVKSHMGYSWSLDSDWVLEHDGTQDKITRADYESAKKEAEETVEVTITSITDGNYMIRLESQEGTHDVILNPSEFAKAITGKLAKGRKIN